MKESELQKAIINYLNKIGMFAWRNNVGAFAGTYKGKKRFIRFSPKGSGDIFAIDKEGRFHSIEIKSKGKNLTTDQHHWMDVVNEHRGYAFYVDSWELWESICRDKGLPI